MDPAERRHQHRRGAAHRRREFVAAARDAGVLVATVGPTAVRLVTHLDVTRDDAEKAAAVLARLA